MRTRTRLKYDHSLVQTVVMLPIVVTAILVVVRDSLALAFSLAGIVAAVRFRNNLREAGDAVYIFGSIGIGFATGIHALGVAAVLSLFFVILELALWKLNFGAEFDDTFSRLCMPSGADLAAPRPTWAMCRSRPETGAPGRGQGLDADSRAVALRIFVSDPDVGPAGNRARAGARCQAVGGNRRGDREWLRRSGVPGSPEEKRRDRRAAGQSPDRGCAPRHRDRRGGARRAALTRFCH